MQIFANNRNVSLRRQLQALAERLALGIRTQDIADTAVTTAKLQDAAVTEAKLDPAIVASLGPGELSIEFTAGAEATDTRRIGMQVVDAAGNPVAGRRAVQWWISSAGEFAVVAAPSAATVAPVTGVILTDDSSRLQYSMMTDAAGLLEVDITVAGTASRWIHAAVSGGEASSSGEVKWVA